MAIRLQRTSGLSCQRASPLGRWQLYAAPSRASAARAALRADCQGNRWCRERGFAHGDKAEPLRRAHHSGVELGVDPGHGISGRSPFAFPKVRCGRSVKSGRMSTSLSICSISVFYCFKAGRGLDGWSMHGVLSSTIFPPTTGPDLASSSMSIPILPAAGSESASVSIASASASQNRPSSMND
jgi:hypothetical protein